MQLCPCGGVIRKHDLSSGRQAWTCGACGRYEKVGRISKEYAHQVLNSVREGVPTDDHLVNMALEVTGDKPVSLTEGDEHE